MSIWNVHLETWKSDAEFWEIYAAKYTILLEKARAFLRLHTERLLDSAPGDTPPKAAIFISAGFDASEWEGSGMGIVIDRILSMDPASSGALPAH
ncbi:hypothetical protein EMGR_000870 [Emarellia grisea]